MKYVLVVLISTLVILTAWVQASTRVISSSVESSDPADAPMTEVGGIIYTNTVWTQANSPYLLTSAIQIAAGVTLTVESGVVISGADNSIIAFGTLVVDGSATNQVILNGVHIEPGVSNYDDHPHLINIQHAHIKDGSVYAPTGSQIYGSINLRDSLIQDVSEIMHLPYPVADSYIERNVFMRSRGISVGSSNAKVYIRNNAFVEQLGNYAIENWASYNSTETVAEFNSFFYGWPQCQDQK